jgi:ubiquitin-conjugating enzyme E2 C
MQIYAGLTFKISISFPANYPYVAPTIKFDTPCYHPNVDITGGAICLDILQVRFYRSGVKT